MPVLGIDVGTQSLKVVVCDDELTVLGEASSHYSVKTPQPGWVEQDPELWVRALAPTVGAALGHAKVSGDAVSAIGIAGQLDGCVAVGPGDRAAGRCLIWMDKRAHGEIVEVDPELTARTGLVADPSHMAPKIRWLRNHRGPATRYHQAVSYLVARLTGEHVFDRGMASTTMLYDVVAGDYDDRLLDAYGITREQLPRIDAAAAVAGALSSDGARLTGLPEGVPVAVGTGDDFATPLGAGVIAPGQIVCGVGTAEVVGALSREPVFDPGALVETHAYANAHYFIENPGWPAGGALRWIGELVGADYPELDRLADTVPPGCDDLLFMPTLAGAMAPEWNAGARGSFYGLTTSHGRGHLARAVMEGCIFATRDVVERLLGLGVSGESLLLVSGGSRSATWAQIRADVVGLPVHVSSLADTCPIGAAMLAAVAGGIQPDLARCAELVRAPTHLVVPNPALRSAYDRSHRRYRKLFDSLRPMFDDR
jgi:xylulokinase